APLGATGSILARARRTRRGRIAPGRRDSLEDFMLPALWKRPLERHAMRTISSNRWGVCVAWFVVGGARRVVSDSDTTLPPGD
ncbi:MAG: hypothetical protein ACN6OP_06380, partial [Pseudomonadales bacterium]